MKLLNTKQIQELLKKLDKIYPQTKCALNYNEPWQLLFAVILSAQCTDVRVNIITETLFKKYPKLEDFRKIPQEELENEIKSAGFYRNKAKAIKGSAEIILKNFHGELPTTMEDLLRLPGVARKTANVTLGECFGKAEGIAVDTHVKRLAGRIGLSKEKTPEAIEKDLMKIIPKNKWIDISHILITHGRKICSARKPECEKCQICDLCLKNL